MDDISFNSNLISRIVDVVLVDLMDRRDVKVPLIRLEEYDPEMFQRMKLELGNRVEAVLRDEE